MQKSPTVKLLEGFGIFMMFVVLVIAGYAIYLGVVEFSVLSRFPQPVTLSYEEFIARHPRDGWFHITGAATNMNEAAWEENIGTGKVTRVFLPLHSLRNPSGGKIQVLVESKDPSILDSVEQRKNQKIPASPFNGMGFPPMLSGFAGNAPNLEGTVGVSMQSTVMANRFKEANVRLQGGLAPDYIYFLSGSSPSMGKAAGLSLFGLALFGFMGFALFKVVQEKSGRL
jgi:hypothetical protein